MTLARTALAALVLVAGAAALAEESDHTARARAHFEAGSALYRLGNYRDALREFAAGFDLDPRPRFLVNLGQTYRKLGDNEKAREMFERYLKSAPPEQERRQIEAVIAELPPPAPPPEPEPEPAPAPASTAAPTPAPAIAATPPPAPKKRAARHLAWILPLSAAVVVGVSLGVYFALRPPSQVGCADAGWGCVPAR